MEYRVEQLAVRAGVSVDTVRYYQHRRLLPPPRRAGRIALYSDDHLSRTERIRALQAKGLTLAVIRRVLDDELDAGDEALAVALAERSAEPGDEEFLTLDDLAERTGVPMALLQSVTREGLLVPRSHDGEAGFTGADIAAVAAGLRLLEHGLPLPEVLSLARHHHAVMGEIAEQAVGLFDEHVRHPLREAGLPDHQAATALVAAFEAMLPAVTTLVAHHFRRILLNVALAHIEHVGGDAELEAVRDRNRRRLEPA